MRAFIGWLRYAACFTLAIATGSGVTLLVATEAWASALLAFGAGCLLCTILAPDAEAWKPSITPRFAWDVSCWREWYVWRHHAYFTVAVSSFGPLGIYWERSGGDAGVQR